MQKSLTVLDFERSLGELDKNIDSYQNAATDRGVDYTAAIEELKGTRQRLLKEFFANLTPWDKVELARHTKRPYSLDYIRMIFDEFTELHGDRLFSDDQSVVCGPARLHGRPVMIISQQKGRDLKERTLRNFGYPRPDGYRKALRLMKLAEKLGMPVISLVDCPAADTNVGSEERGISDAIARNLWEMSVLRTPIVCAVVGEGGSGGALALAVSDRTLMFEHAIFSVIPPEGCAAILETFGRDPNRKDEAAIALRLTAKDAQELGLVDEVMLEPLGGAHRNPSEATETLREALERTLDSLVGLDIDTLLERRYARFRGMGVFDVRSDAETEPEPAA